MPDKANFANCKLSTVNYLLITDNCSLITVSYFTESRIRQASSILPSSMSSFDKL